MAMRKRFTSLSFIIGLFFVLMALILLVGYCVSLLLNASINLYVGIAFLLFGLLMMAIKEKSDEA